MEMETSSIAAKKMSFWELINQSIVRIPNYQREYAQGRNNRRAELIRSGFVSSLYNSITNNESLELDFIFGGKESNESDDSFNPVDGQQRLTMLFLLHWYVFIRAEKKDYLRRLESNFLYMTRTTSETFCKMICGELCDLDFDENADKNISISSQIKEQPWFTGRMGSDPTVKSMLVVIDCIHGQFQNFPNYEEIAKILTSTGCPITFFCLDLNESLGISSAIRDLYIKMNARGVPLTDFELFKANLQKRNGKSEYVDLMAEYLGDKDAAFKRVEVIGKFNNSYTNFFFNLIDDGKIINPMDNTSKVQMFDVSFMNFINEIFRMNYFCTISKEGVSQKKYRSDNDAFRKMSGKEFISFIETSGEIFNEKYWKDGQIPPKSKAEIKKSMIDSFGDIIKLLDEFSTTGVEFDTGDVKCRYVLSEMIKKYAADPQKDKALPFKESLVRMALYEFVRKFGIPSDEKCQKAFMVWSRFIWKIDRNSEFKNFDEVIETLIGYKDIMKNCVVCTADAFMEAIVKCEYNDRKVLAAPAKLQLEEEIIKTKLMSSDKKWEDAIKEAEDFYSDCGQICFLLDLSKCDDSNYDLKRFIKALHISKKLFDSSRHITEKIDSNRFERALLAVQGEYDQKDHLFSMGKYTTETKRFVGRDFSKHISHQYRDSSESKEQERYGITIALLREMVDDTTFENINDATLKNWLDTYIDKGGSKIEWKNVFIKNSLLDKEINGLKFKNGFEPDAWNENDYKYTAIYTNEMKRTCSGELYSFLLALKLSEEGVSIEYHTNSQEEYIFNEFPNRYFTIKMDGKEEMDIGYMCGEFYFRRNEMISKLGNLEAAFEKLSS